MKRTILTLLVGLMANLAFADSVLIEGFEYANQDFQTPIGWTCDDNSWLCGYQEKDHNRLPHSGNWYAFTNDEEAWMFMPMSLFNRMDYRFICWTISDGAFQLEFWAGNEAMPDNMHTLLLSASVSGGNYEMISSYVDSIPDGCNYIAIHALASPGASYLTIDDIEIDMVQQYDFEAITISNDTVMYPGTQAAFRYIVHNTGYDPLDITAHPSNEYFTDFSCYANGISGMTFPTQPDETVEVVFYATLRPEVEPGSMVWLDIMMTIPCGCNTAMATFWVTPLEPMQVDENHPNISIYPNPAQDHVTIELEGLERVCIIDETGKTIKSVPANGNALQLDLTDLKAGYYFISAKTRSTSSFVKPILKM